MEKDKRSSGAPKCERCDDTGVIDTGNNDFPCDCPAAETVIFNVMGRGQVTGKQLLDEFHACHKMPLPDYLK